MIDEQKFYKRKVLFLSFAIILVIGLMIFLVVVSKGNNCERCKVEFKNTQVSGVMINNNQLLISERMIDLHGNLSEGRCLVMFDRNRGYYGL